VNLITTISVYGGGPGSGCTGPDCGRPPLNRTKIPGSLGIPRSDMPQLATKRGEETIDLTPNFLKHMSDSGIPVTTENVPAKNLNPVQDEVNENNIKRMMERTTSGERAAQGVVISKDNYILDGHHEWVAYSRLYGKDTHLKVYRVGLPINKLMYEAETFSQENGISHRSVESAAAIRIYSGGEGSGCRGPNCGRPSEQSHGALKMPRGKQTLKRIDKEIRKAAAGTNVILMEYKGDEHEGKAKSYLVEPYSYRNDGKTFFGFDQTAKSIKAFKMMNIVRVSPLSKKFKKRWPVELAS
jgi:hypothetical protein